MARRRGGGEVYLEFIPNGAYVKVSAVDAATGTEVSIVGDGRASQAEMERIVLRKLERALEKQANEKRR